MAIKESPSASIAAEESQIAKAVLMPGDPLRAKYVADHYLEDVVCFNTVRNMLGYTGTYKGKRISVMGHGMGVPSMGIYSYELYQFFGVDTILRIGSAGGIGDDVKVRAKAYAAAGSDARMNGCELPVVIVSGSGNQGITASVPVVVYAKELGASEEKMLRAVVLSDLITIHQKSGIGRLSAYCGAISAGCGAGAGIAYLYGGGYEEIAHTVVNALAVVSGVVCDGAKASCAAKIAAAVDAGILGYWMYRDGNQFFGGDGIVSKGVENTIRNVGRLAREGMKETDKEIIKIMLE